MAGLAQMNVKKSGKEEITKLIGLLMSVRTASHLAHLKTSSYATHVALNGFYDEVLDLTDTFAENAQGLYGKLDIPFVNMIGNANDPIGMLSSYLKQMDVLAESCSNRVLESIYQEIQSLFYKTQYLLTELS